MHSLDLVAAAPGVIACNMADTPCPFLQLDWDLPDYPQLPKMFTNAKAAKKRKHKEFIMTDADLDTVVKIPRPAAAAAGEGGVKEGMIQLFFSSSCSAHLACVCNSCLA